jgi:hypothetical protein
VERSNVRLVRNVWNGEKRGGGTRGARLLRQKRGQSALFTRPSRQEGRITRPVYPAVASKRRITRSF